MKYWLLFLGWLLGMPAVAAESSSYAAERIVSLAPSLTELVYAVGGEDRLVGTIRYSDYPPAARKLPRVGDALRLDLEKLLSLRPDLILAWGTGTPAHVVEELRELGLKVDVTEPRHLDDIPRLLTHVGELVGQPANAERVASDFRARLQALAERYRNKKTVKVFYQISAQPLMSINGEHIINEAIELCGGENVFAEVDRLTPILSVEAVHLARPDVILYGEFGDVKKTADQAVPWLNKDLLDVPVLPVSADLLHRATPRMLQGIEQLCERIDGVRGGRLTYLKTADGIGFLLPEKK